MTSTTCRYCGVKISEHEATRCLDAWVSEIVFKAIVTEQDNVRGFRASFPTTFGTLTHYVPRYSSDISAAWEVAEKMMQKAPANMWFCVWSIMDAARWVAGYMKYDESDGDVVWVEEASESAPTVPLAICRAAVMSASEGNISLSADGRKYVIKDLGYQRTPTDAVYDVEMPDGVWRVPVQVIVDNRDEYYKNEKEDTVKSIQDGQMDVYEISEWAKKQYELVGCL